MASSANFTPDAGLVAAARSGCPEARRLMVSRRGVLGITAGLFSGAFLPRWANAASADPRLLVVVLRGGMDGINVVIPHGDAAYAGMRGAIAFSREATLRLDDFYGLNPAMPNFAALYAAGEAAAIHATCTPLRNRSHFDCQDNLENGLPGIGSNATGWLNRLLSAMPAGSAIATEGAIQIGEAPLILRGPVPVLGWSPTWFQHAETKVANTLKTLYRGTDPALYTAFSNGLKADALAESTVGSEDDNVSSFRKAFRGAGKLLAAPGGPRIAVLSVDNFDTHSDQGLTSGYLHDSLDELDQGLAEFKSHLGSIWSDTVVVMATEFGRTVHVNGSKGTDHGVGTVTLLAGGAINGGKVYGEWPGIAESNLYEQSDLQPTTDLRAVFKGVLADHVGVPEGVLSTTIFPESAAVTPFAGLIRSATSTDARARSAFRPALIRPPSGIASYRAKYASEGAI